MSSQPSKGENIGTWNSKTERGNTQNYNSEGCYVETDDSYIKRNSSRLPWVFFSWMVEKRAVVKVPAIIALEFTILSFLEHEASQELIDDRPL